MTYSLSQSLGNVVLTDHSRRFECRVTNANGSTTINTTIEVFGVPGPINHTTITSSSISLISMRFTFTAPIDNNAPITGYSYILCQYTCFNLPSPMVIPNDTSLLTGSRPSFIIGGLAVPDVPHRLYILASNEAGMGPNSTEAFEFCSSSQADASPAGLMVDPTFTTQNSLVFTWTLPPLGSESDITASLFTVTWRRQGGNPSTIVVPFSGGRTSRQGVAITNLTVGMPHDVWVIANYSTPMLDSDPAMATGTTLSAGQDPTPLRPEPPSAGTNNEIGLTITWLAPTGALFFNNRYRIRYTFTSTLSRQKRQTSGENAIFVDETTLTLTPPTLQPVSVYVFNVDAEILPPGSPSPAYVPATPSITVTSSAQAPNAPTGVAAVPSSNGNPYQALDVSWVNPTMPNGVLLRCIFDFSLPAGKGNSVIIAHNGEVPQNTTLNNLMPGTRYVFTMHCFSGRDNGSDPGVRGETSMSEEATTMLGVFKPIVNVTDINHDQRLITVSLAIFSHFGPHASYRVVIADSEDALVNINALEAYPGVNGAYVTYAGITGGANSLVTVIIGSGSTTTIGQDTYQNRGLEPGSYFILVRLFSATAGGVFNESSVVNAVIIDCGALTHPLNGQVNTSFGTTYNQVATYSCDTGYNLVGPSTRTCQTSGTWSSTAPVCESLCPLLTLSNGIVTYSMSGDPPPVGTVATYSCATGYDLTGNGMRICEEGTGWTGSLPACNIIDCGALTRPLNGQVNTSSGTTYTQMATYSCASGYNLVGSSTRTCQANGMWSFTASVCQFIQLSIGDTILTSNSVISVTDIGEGVSALTCHTELTACCREQDNPSGGALGEWIGPDSNQIPESSTTSGFYVSRQQFFISLNRGSNGNFGGQYCCVIPRTGETMTFCVNVQSLDETSSSNSQIVGLSVAIAVILVVSITIVATLVIIIIIIIIVLKRGQHQEASYCRSPDKEVYEDTSKTDLDGASDHTHTPAMELNTYVTTEVSTEKREKEDAGEEGLHQN